MLLLLAGLDLPLGVALLVLLPLIASLGNTSDNAQMSPASKTGTCGTTARYTHLMNIPATVLNSL